VDLCPPREKRDISGGPYGRIGVLIIRGFDGEVRAEGINTAAIAIALGGNRALADRLRYRFPVVIVGVLALAEVVALGQAPPPIRGVWRVVEVTTAGPNASINASPQPGLFIFTEKHYSIMRDTSPGVRPSVSDPANITASEALAVFGPFMAQSGTYELAGETLRVTPMVAKVPPANGKYGASNTWSVRLHADALWLTPTDGLRERLTGSRATIANPTTVKLLRVE
jgi:hypothetical protein